MNVKTITAPNANHALAELLHWLVVAGEVTTSRNGLVLRAPGPVLTTTQQPAQRVMFSALRDANPFFHLMESIWMFAGRNDVEFVARYVKRMAQYSDDAVTIPGAYGHRWRKHFGVDQLLFVVEELRRDHDSRRAVIAMWDPVVDIEAARNSGADVPCNTTIYFSVRTRDQVQQLDMTVCCRSNDAVWGAYGANTVHFSMLQQFVAESIGMAMGYMHQFSNDMHVYLENPVVQRLLTYTSAIKEVKYQAEDKYPLFASEPVERLLAAPACSSIFLMDAEVFIDLLMENVEAIRDTTFGSAFFNETVVPAALAHLYYTKKQFARAFRVAYTIKSPDWRIACSDWLWRRMKCEC